MREGIGKGKKVKLSGDVKANKQTNTKSEIQLNCIDKWGDGFKGKVEQGGQ